MSRWLAILKSRQSLEVFHLYLRNSHLTNMFSTGLTVLSIQRLKATATVWSAILHDIALPPKNCLTFETREVFHVPVAPLCLRAFISKDDLLTQIYVLRYIKVFIAVINLTVLVRFIQDKSSFEVIMWMFFPHDIFFSQYINLVVFTSSQAEQRGFSSSAWCLPQWIFPSW